jgi:group I intron endonuclease
VRITVYLIRNLANGKEYVGQSRNSLRVRFQQHVCLANRNGACLLSKAIRKYGRGSFEIEDLAYCKSLPAADKIEKRLIKERRTLCPHGYNIHKGGQGRRVIGESTRRKLAERTITQEWRDKISKSRTGQKMSAETKARLIAVITGSSRPKCSKPGERNPNAKLKSQDVLEIRRLYSTGEFSQQQIADRFGINQPAVGRIVRRVAWASLLDEENL